MIRLYRVKCVNRHGETVIVRAGIPADIADGVLYDFANGRCEAYDWYRVWIETEDGRLVDHLERPPLG